MADQRTVKHELAARGPICTCASENQSVMNIIKILNNLRADIKIDARLPVKQLIFLFWPNIECRKEM